MNQHEQTTRYPMLEAILTERKLPLLPMYTTRTAAQVFGVTGRALLNWIKSGQLAARDLPGRARFLNQDLEDFLAASKKDVSQVA